MQHFLRIILLLSLAALSASSNATTYNFSYKFTYEFDGDGPSDGPTVTGTFEGKNLDGGLVTGLSNISVFVNGVGFSNNRAVDAFRSGSDTDAVVSFNALKNDFAFLNGPVGTSDFLIFAPGGFAWLATSRYQYLDKNPPLIQSQWHLAAVSSVPESEIYAMLLAGFGLMGFVARRRKQA